MENAKVICGEWNLAQEIGRGAYGVVYLAQNAAGECVALKVCRREMTELVKRFLRYVSFDMQSSEASKDLPSTPGQRVLAEGLRAN